MAQEKQETREEEVARVRSYLASQAMRRTPEQLVEALRENSDYRTGSCTSCQRKHSTM